jgi:predicted MPP superfamily phosphohydrolase
LDDFRRFLRTLIDTAVDHWLFIDDFHYLENPDYRRELSYIVKALADQSRSHAKITLIGINPLGEALLQTTPDLAGRFRIMHLHQAPEAERNSRISELISLGEHAAGVRFLRRDEFVFAARGSFFVAQFLCNRAARQAGVLATQRRIVDIQLGPADVVASIQDELVGNYRAPLLRLAAFDSVSRPRGAGLSLLWLLSRSAGGFVSIRDAELRFPRLKPVFDWFLQSNLSTCFEQYPALRGLLYFNRATGTLTMEDPQLDFYLRNLDWLELALASGHGHVVFHPDDGPLWPVEATVSGTLEGTTLQATASVLRIQRVLHLSDLHFDAPDQATIAYSQLAADLRQQGVEQLDAVIISGDLVNRATAPEYKVAEEFLEKLKSGFAVSAQSMVLVPGNHDVSWAYSEAAYSLTRRTQLPAPPAPGTYIEHTPEIIDVRDDSKYRLRFTPFGELYEKVRGEAYPLAYEQQATIFHIPGGGLTILGLNSAWEIDHKFRDRASIHMGALANALLALPRQQSGELRIAVFHHPLHSDEESRIRDSSFLQQLAVSGFRAVLHGHVHRADNTLYRYDRSVGGRQIEVVTAGTFGAPVREWVPGYPLQYNLLLIHPTEIVVETRCRTELNGAWQPDPRWLQGPGQNPLPRYVISR